MQKDFNSVRRCNISCVGLQLYYSSNSVKNICVRVFLYLCLYIFFVHINIHMWFLYVSVSQILHVMLICVCRLVWAQLTQSVSIQHVLVTSLETVATYILLPGPWNLYHSIVNGREAVKQP